VEVANWSTPYFLRAFSRENFKGQPQPKENEMNEKKGKTIYPEGREDVRAGNYPADEKPHDLTLRVSLCEIEIKNLKYQFHVFCNAFMNKHKKASSIEKLTVGELLKAGEKTGMDEKGFSRKIANKISRFINGK
jgi:hypothetical protein